MSFSHNFIQQIHRCSQSKHISCGWVLWSGMQSSLRTWTWKQTRIPRPPAWNISCLMGTCTMDNTETWILAMWNKTVFLVQYLLYFLSRFRGAQLYTLPMLEEKWFELDTAAKKSRDHLTLTFWYWPENAEGLGFLSWLVSTSATSSNSPPSSAAWSSNRPPVESNSPPLLPNNSSSSLAGPNRSSTIQS